MKNLYILLFLLFTCHFSFAQEWFDGKCDIEAKVDQAAYKNAKVKNILTIIIDQNNNIILNDKPHKQMSQVRFKEYVLDFITNPENTKTSAESPESAIIALTSFGEKEKMQLIQKYVREVYLYLWNQKSEEVYNSSWMDLKCAKREKVLKKHYPYNLIELKDDMDSEKSKDMKIPSPPRFEGDVKDN
ncbi:MAG: hypothetical protein ACTHY4_01115 [Flavobacteriaceae bacterium]|nr:hypothetical protein [Psychroflexus sp.]